MCIRDSPWALVFIGVFIALVIEILGISVLPVAIGLYLPLELSATIMIGGLIRHFVDKKSKDKDKDNEASGGILFCSGLIAGEGLVGILLAIFAVVGLADPIDLSGIISLGTIGSVVLMAVSYTHLDVYKRQVMLWHRRNCSIFTCLIDKLIN